jgi:hypothetical protein
VPEGRLVDAFQILIRPRRDVGHRPAIKQPRDVLLCDRRQAIRREVRNQPMTLPAPTFERDWSCARHNGCQDDPPLRQCGALSHIALAVSVAEFGG